MARKHPAKLVLVAATAALLAGCATAPPVESKRPMSTGNVLAGMACQFQIKRAEAWINMMPGASRQLHVAVQLGASDDLAVLIKADASTAEQLVLEIRSAQAAPMPGQLAYSEPATTPPVKRIALMCRGGEVGSINNIQTVY